MAKKLNIPSLKNEDKVKKVINHSSSDNDIQKIESKKIVASIYVEDQVMELIKDLTFQYKIQNGTQTIGDTLKDLIHLYIEEKGNISPRPDGLRKKSIHHGEKIKQGKGKKLGI